MNQDEQFILSDIWRYGLFLDATIVHRKLSKIVLTTLDAISILNR